MGAGHRPRASLTQRIWIGIFARATNSRLYPSQSRHLFRGPRHCRMDSGMGTGGRKCVFTTRGCRSAMTRIRDDGMRMLSKSEG